MTGLLAGSLAALVASAGALVAGWVSASGVLVWLSIAASVGAGLLLALAWSRARQEAALARRRALTRRPAGAQAAAGGPEEVVAVPERGRYHRPDCRFAHVPGATPMTRAAARRARLQACGVCKP